MNNDASQNDDTVLKSGRKLQLVHAGSSQFGIFADEISTIVAWQEPTPLPRAPGSVLGVVNIQGRMLTVLDLATLPDLAATLSAGQRQIPRHIIALRGDEQLALAADSVDETAEFTPGDFTTTPETVTTPVLGVLQRRGAEIRILNIQGLFPTALQGRQRRQRQF